MVWRNPDHFFAHCTQRRYTAKIDGSAQ